MDKITLGEKEYDLEEDEDNFAYKDGVVYKVFKTTKSVMAMGCIGAMRFVFDESDNIISESYPMTNLNKGFELISKGKIDNYSKVLTAFQKFKNE